MVYRVLYVGGGDECFAAREILYLCTSYNFVVFIILFRPSSLLQTPPADISLSLTPSASRLNLHPYHLSLCPPPSQSEHLLGVRGRSKPKQEKEDKKKTKKITSLYTMIRVVLVTRQSSLCSFIPWSSLFSPHLTPLSLSFIHVAIHGDRDAAR